jgi:hypothetical protein
MVDGKGNPIFWKFSDKWWNIYAPEIADLLSGKYPDPTKEDLIKLIEKAQTSRGTHSEQGKKMKPEEIFEKMMALPGIEPATFTEMYDTGVSGKKTEQDTNE